MEAMLTGIGNLTQIAQLVVNMEFFRLAAEKLEGSLANIRSVLIKSAPSAASAFTDHRSP